MRIILFRHGEAHQVGERGIGADPDRTLSSHGRDQSKRAGSFLSLVDEEPEAVLSSPYVRARESAEQAISRMKGEIDLVFLEVLSPEGSAKEMLAELYARGHESVMLVGHEPGLGSLFRLLLDGSPEPSIHLSKGSLVCLESDLVPGGGIKIRWLLNSGMIRDILKQTR